MIDFRNNVICNWEYSGGYAGGSDAKLRERTRCTYAQNYLKPGLDTKPAYRRLALQVNPGAVTRMYVAGNFLEGFPEGSADNWRLIHNAGGSLEKLAEPIPMPPVSADDPQTCYDRVLEAVGAVLPTRDAVDRRIVEGVRTGQGRRAFSQDDVGGWLELRSGNPPADQDQDGMPDRWERQFGLDPSDARDQQQDADRDGYANIEEFLSQTHPHRPD
jgi:hypothetical protein